MKKILLFAGVAGLLLSANAFADVETFAGDHTDTPSSYPAFDGTYTNVSTNNNTEAADTYRYAAKRETDNTLKVKAATVQYVNNRSSEVAGLVTTLSTRADDDQDIVETNQEDLEGATNATEWADLGLENNRQVTATTNSDCSSSWLAAHPDYSGCGYIANDGDNIDGQTTSDYKWIKIVTNCAVPGQEGATNCGAGSTFGQS